MEEEGQRKLILLSLGMQFEKTKQTDLTICLQTTLQLTVGCSVGRWSKFSASQEKVLVFLSKRTVHENHKGQTLKPSLSSTSAQANKIRPGVLVLDGKQAWRIWSYFNAANAFMCAPQGNILQMLPGVSICRSPMLEHLSLNIGNPLLFQRCRGDAIIILFLCLASVLFLPRNFPPPP